MAKLKTSLVCTVLNEEKNIELFIDSILGQTVLPSELIIADGGSKDRTIEKIKNQESRIKDKKIEFKLIEKKGNRSTGRNEGIKQASFEIILLTDSGCILDKNWIKEITKPFADKETEVVAGYYKGEPKTVFQKCLIPYVLVMPDKVDEENFLPATRSMAIRKSTWKKTGGFNEKLSHNEDYAFANKLKDANIKISFAKKAIVKWIPRNNLAQVFKMFFRFALGDIQAGLIRTRVLFVFLRYMLGLYFIYLGFAYKSILIIYLLLFVLIIYILWSIIKNYKYILDKKSFLVLPVLQFTADIAVILGSMVGLLKLILDYSYRKWIIKNKLLFITLIIYVFINIATISWGAPNPNHPFAYHMDEWHSVQSLRSVIKSATAGIEGGAYGTIFYYFTTAIYLIPFVLFGFVNPLAIKSSVENLIIQQRLFEVLRFSTILYGISSIILFNHILRKFFVKNNLVGIFIFIISPIFIVSSNFFKYDIANLFWIILSMYFLLTYSNQQNLRIFVISGIICALAISVKIASLPLAIIYVISYFIFTDNFFKKLKYLAIGIFSFFITLLLFGMPDIFSKYQTYNSLIAVNIDNISSSVSNINLGFSWWLFLLIKEFPSIFGIFTISLFYFSFLFLFAYLFFKIITNNFKEYKILVFLFIFLIVFVMSLITLNLGAGSNRSLVLLPLFAIFISLVFDMLYKIKSFRKILIIIVFMGLLLQTFQTISWVYLKTQQDSRTTASVWILNNVPKGTTIGIENIPIYQMLPDIILKEFYLKQYKKNVKLNFNYQIISASSITLPKIIVIQNGELESKYLKNSPKNDLLKRLNREGYKKKKVFSTNLLLYDIFSDRILLLITNIVPIPENISIYYSR